jgi:predicted glutamine amidotransferase
MIIAKHPALRSSLRFAGAAAMLALAGAAVLLCDPAALTVRPEEHECHLFGYVFGSGAGSIGTFTDLCQALHDQTLLAGLERGREGPGGAPRHEGPGGTLRREDRAGTPSRDGWGFAYFLSPPQDGIERPILIKSGAAASDDDQRWQAAQDEIQDHALGGASVVVGHVRRSSYGPDEGALPNPHPFADSLMGRWWHFSHNGHMKPDTLLPWIPVEFLERHPLDYTPIHVDSEVLFRYCQYEIERLGTVREGLLYAFHRVKNYYDFVFNITLTDGDTLWAAHSHTVPFYYHNAGGGSAWWVSTVDLSGDRQAMPQHQLMWFSDGGMGEASYE